MLHERRILVVDDDEATRRLLTMTLTRKAYSVAAAATGAEAMTLLQSGGFDLVLLDLLMPEPGGVEVFRAIRAMQPPPECIVISGLADLWLRRNLAAPPYAVFSKPIAMNDLVDLIGRFFAERESA